MLFLLIVSQAVLEVQKSEPLEADEAWEALLQEATELVAKLDAAHVFSRVLLQIAKDTPFTSQSLKSRVGVAGDGDAQPAAPLLSPRVLFLQRPLPQLPAYTLFALAVALPFRLQSFYINNLDALPHAQRLSFAAYFQLFVTPAVAKQPVPGHQRAAGEVRDGGRSGELRRDARGADDPHGRDGAAHLLLPLGAVPAERDDGGRGRAA